MAALDGLKILVPESRELDLFASMLEGEGATALRCPLVQILDLENTTEARVWIDQAIADTFQDIVWLTGEGLRRLLPIARHMKREDAFIAALGRARNITRGPKPASVLRTLGLAPGLAVRIPTAQGVLDALVEEDLTGRSIGVQMYPGDGAMPFLAKLYARGARGWPVTPYRYASETETDAVANVIRKLANGQVDLIVFTATPQVERLLQVGRETGLGKELAAGLARTPIAAIGPVVEDTLRLHGLTATLRPESSFHLKPLIRAIIAWRSP